MLKTMIVDDEALFREYLCSVIKWETHGFAICGQARNGFEAIKMVKVLKPDIVLADINMPIKDGMSFAEHIISNYPDIDIILITGHSEFKYAQRAVKIGVFDYILKPVDEEELSLTLQKIKEKRQKTAKQVTIDENNAVVVMEKLFDFIDSNKVTKTGRIVQSAIDYIDNNFTDSNLRLEEVAKSVFVNPSYLGVIFKKETGITVGECIVSVRMQKAREFLGTGNTKLSDIACRVGYSDASYFSKCFKKHFGISPTDYELLKK